MAKHGSITAAVHCPCCLRAVQTPTPDVIVAALDIPPMQERILRAVWGGNGRPVQTERLFGAMYADDPDGGPSQSQMYVALKNGLFRLRASLEGSGVGVETVGYGRGYRLVLQ